MAAAPSQIYFAYGARALRLVVQVSLLDDHIYFSSIVFTIFSFVCNMEKFALERSAKTLVYEFFC